MITLIAMQLGLPLLLTAWLWLWPSGNRFALTLQIAAIGTAIIAVWTVGIWTLVPRWSLGVIAVFALIAVILCARRPASTLGRWTWIQSLVSLVLLIVGGGAISEAWRAHQPPPIASIRLALPLDGDDLVVANGGSKLLLNAHQDTLDLTVPRHAHTPQPR